MVSTRVITSERIMLHVHTWFDVSECWDEFFLAIQSSYHEFRVILLLSIWYWADWSIHIHITIACTKNLCQLQFSCNISTDIMNIFWNSCLQAVSQTQGHVGRILSIVFAHAELYYMPIPLLMSFCFWFLAVLLSWQRHTQVLKGMIWFCSRRLPAICFLHVELSMLSR